MEAIRQRQEQSQFMGGKMAAIRRRQQEEAEEELARRMDSTQADEEEPALPQHRHGGKMEAIRRRQKEAESRPSDGGMGGGKMEAIRRRQETENVARAVVWGGGKMEAIRRKQQYGEDDVSDDDLQSPMQEEVAATPLPKASSPVLAQRAVPESSTKDSQYRKQVEDKEDKPDEENEEKEHGDEGNEKDEDFQPVPTKKKVTKRREPKHSKKSEKQVVTEQPKKTAIEIEQEKLEEFERRKEEEARRKAEALEKEEEEEVEPVGKRTKRTTRKTPTEKAKEESRAAARANLVARRNNSKVRGDESQENEGAERESNRYSVEAEAALKTEEEELEAQLRKMPPKKAAAERKRMQKVKAERAAERERLRKLEQQNAAEGAADEEVERSEASQREVTASRLPNDDVSVFSSDSSGDDEDAHQRSLQEEEEEDAETGQPLTLEKLNSIRLPRHVLEEWAMEPWLDEAVRGSFVRLGIGLYDGVQQYRICEVVRVDEYRHQYTFGKFYVSKGLVLRIGRNERLWRMNLISNHRFSEIEFDVWKEDMAKDRARLPSVKEVERRKKLREEAVAKGRSMDKTDEMINAKLENAAKRIEVARYRDSGAPNVKGLNQGQWHTKLEWKLGSARDAYVEKLLAGAKNIPELAKRASKIDDTDAAVRKLDDFDKELNDFAKDLEQAHVALGLPNEVPELRDARHEYNRARRALHDFEQNCIQTSRQRDLDAPHRAAELAAVNNRNKQENLRMDLEHASQANAAERDKEQSVYHRRSTKPTMLWSTNTASAPNPAPVQGQPPAPPTTEPAPSTTEPAPTTIEPAPSTIAAPPSAEVPVVNLVVGSPAPAPLTEDGERQKEIDHILQLVLNAKPKPKQFVPTPPDQLPTRRGMSLAEYIAKTRRQPAVNSHQ